MKEVVNKMKKLRQKYKSEKDNARKSGNNRKKPWKYFEQLDRFLSQKHNVTPAALLDTMDACQEDDELNLQKNVADNHSENDHTVGMNFGKHVYIYIYIYTGCIKKKLTLSNSDCII